MRFAYGFAAGGFVVAALQDNIEFMLWGFVVGLALGTINWYIATLAEKHYLKD